MIRISFENSGGLLQSMIVESPVDVPEAIYQMAREAGELFPGDKFIISDTDEG